MSQTNADMPRMMVGLVKQPIKNSNATEANELDADLDNLIAEAEAIANNADVILAEFVEVDEAIAA